MYIVPVIDVKDGVAVQKRPGSSDFQRLQSTLVPSAEPAAVLRNLQAAVPCGSFFITDINARRDEGNNFGVIREMIRTASVDVLVDTAARSLVEAQQQLSVGAALALVGTKRLRTLDEGLAIVSALGSNKVTVHLEMNGHSLYTQSPELRPLRPLDFLGHFYEAGVRNFVVVELSSVSTAGGLNHLLLRLLVDMRQRFPGVTLLAGGGIRDFRDLGRLRDIGVTGALLSSALHGGQISGDGLAKLTDDANRGISYDVD